MDGVLYVLGGYEGGHVGTVVAYDPDVGRWEERAPLHTARGFFGTAVVDGRIVVVAGRTRPPAPTEVYDPARDAWTVGASDPEARNRFPAVAWRGRVLAMGGEADYGNRTAVEVLVYDPEADTWSR